MNYLDLDPYLIIGLSAVLIIVVMFTAYDLFENELVMTNNWFTCSMIFWVSIALLILSFIYLTY